MSLRTFIRRNQLLGRMLPRNRTWRVAKLIMSLSVTLSMISIILLMKNSKTLINKYIKILLKI